MKDWIFVAFTLGFGAANVFLCWLISRVYVSAASAYWGAWVLTLLCYMHASSLGYIPTPEPGVWSMILRLHAGAFVGFVGGSLVAGRSRRASMHHLAEVGDKYGRFWDRYAHYFLAVVVIAGLAHLYTRLGVITSPTESALLDVRLSFLEQGLSPLGRMASYISLVTVPLAVVLGISDSRYGIRIKRLLFLIMATAPHGLAMGGRGFLLALAIPYVLSFLLTRQFMAAPSSKGTSIFHLAKADLVQIVGLLAALVVVFGTLGALRDGGVSSGAADLGGIGFLNMILIRVTSWFGVTIPAIAPFTEVFENLGPGYGAKLFDGIFWQMQKFLPIGGMGINDLMMLGVDEVKTVDLRLGIAPASIIPYLAFDWGLRAMPVAAAAILGFSQFVSIRLKAGGALSMLIAVLACLVALYSVQGLFFLTTANIGAILYMVLIEKLSSASAPARRGAGAFRRKTSVSRQ